MYNRIICLLLIAVILSVSTIITVNAQENKTYILEEKFDEWMPTPKYDPSVSSDSWGCRINYDELYYSYGEDGSTLEWALICSDIDSELDWYGNSYFRVGDIILVDKKDGAKAFWPLGLYLYDADEDTFYYLDEMPGADYRYMHIEFNYGRQIDIDDLDKYSELYNVLKEKAEWYHIGDVDFDGSVSILDATRIQRYLAGFFPEVLYPFNEIGADPDMDGLISILDATKIQRYLVGLDSICGRYAEDTEKTD